MKITLSVNNLRRLRRYGLTLERLTVLLAADKPQSIIELSKRTGVSRPMIYDFLYEDSGWLTGIYTNIQSKRKDGGTVSHLYYIRTKKTERLLGSLK